MRNAGFRRILLTSFTVMALTMAILPLAHALAAPPSQGSRTSSALNAAKQQPLDLNTAGVADLRRLPGIGDAYAKRIVDGRPYTAKNQLVTRGVLPQTTYEQIKDLVVAHRAPAK